MRYEIVNGLPDQLRPKAALLYWQAFRTKLGKVLGPKDKALAFLRQDLNGLHCVIAKDSQGQLLGLAGFQTSHGSFSQGQSTLLCAVYGRFGAAWRRRFFYLLRNQNSAAASFMVDTIAVDPQMQRQGIGAALLEELCELALSMGHAHIALDVDLGNLAAQRLYARHGFLKLEVQNLGILGWILGVQKTLVMRRNLLSQMPLEPDQQA